MKRPIALIILLITVLGMKAQPYLPENGEVFSTNTVLRIDVYVDADSLNTMLLTLDKENPLSASVYIQTENSFEVMDNVGFRLRGNTSLLADKKSWKLDFNEFISGQKYMDLEKLNLKGMHNDPSISRSKICWDLFRAFNVPAPRASFAELYINDENYGVFCTVEHIDEVFIDSRFGNNDGDLFKCTWPADLTWQGVNPNNYNAYGYDLKINEQQNSMIELIQFISTLNLSNDLECELPEVFNVESYLKVMAIDVLSGNWDGPIYNKNNFYLYHNTQTDQFEYIPYDLDNTWGIDWLGIDWGQRNIYSWDNSSEDRPLFTRIMEVESFRDKFSEYVYQVIMHIDNSDYEDSIDELAILLASAISSDPYYPLTYGYDFNDFLTSFSDGLPGGSSHDNMYGIHSYIDARTSSAMSQLDADWSVAPSISYLDVDGGFLGDELFITALVEDNNDIVEVRLEWSDDGGPISNLDMKDDGISPDLIAGDRIFSAAMSPDGIQLLKGQIRAIDSESNESLYPCEPKYLRDLEYSVHQLYINEFMPSNTSSHSDEAGEYDDWIELYNGGETSLYIGNYYLTDNFEKPHKFQLPQMTLGAGEYLIIWADKDKSQGDRHANFKLEADSEEIGLFEPIIDRFKPIDLIRYADAQMDESYGYLPDATGPSVLQDFPTPGSANGVMVGIEKYTTDDIRIYPNPASDILHVHSEHEMQLILYDLNLAQLKKGENKSMNISELEPGIYFLDILNKDGQSLGLKKFIKQ